MGTDLYVDITAMVQQGPYTGDMLLVDGHMQRAAPPIVQRVDLRSFGQQELQHLWLVPG